MDGAAQKVSAVVKRVYWLVIILGAPSANAVSVHCREVLANLAVPYHYAGGAVRGLLSQKRLFKGTPYAEAPALPRVGRENIVVSEPVAVGQFNYGILASFYYDSFRRDVKIHLPNGPPHTISIYYPIGKAHEADDVISELAFLPQVTVRATRDIAMAPSRTAARNLGFVPRRSGAGFTFTRYRIPPRSAPQSESSFFMSTDITSKSI